MRDLGARFEAINLLGSGTEADVYRVRETAGGAEFAMKIAKEPGNANLRLALRAEFRLLVKLRHPHIVAAHEFGSLPDGSAFYTMDLVTGPSLDTVEAEARSTLKDRLVEALRALAFVHDQGILHADLKPANLRIGADGHLKLMDFGLARPIGSAESTIRGTPHYIAPEIARGERADVRSDLYGLGAVFYHLAAGRPPFEGTRPADLIRAHLHEVPPALAAQCPDAPADLVQVVTALLAKAPLDRPQDAAAALRDLGESAIASSGGLLEPPLVGRDDQIATVLGRLESLQQPDARPTGLHLDGGEGSGKTRLLEALRGAAQGAGFSAFLVAGIPYSGLPYTMFGPLKPALASLLEPGDGGLVAAIDEEPPGLEPRAARARRQEAWARLIAAAATEKPVLLLFDDFEAADEATYSLVDALLARADLKLVTVTVGIKKPNRAEVLALTPLDASGTGRMAAGALGLKDIPDYLAARLYDLSEGNPAMTLSILQALIDRGELRRDAGMWQLDGLQLSAADLPTDRQSWLTQQVKALPQDALRLGQLLSLARKPMPLTSLGAVLELADDALAEAADQLRSSGWLQTEADGVLLGQGQIKAVLAESWTRDAARKGHAALAAVFETLPGVPAALMVHHLEEAGLPERAAPYGVAAAKQELAEYMLVDATVHAQNALRVLPAADPLRSEALEVWGDDLRYTGSSKPAFEKYEEAKGSGSPRVARLLVNQALCCHNLSRFDDGTRLAKEGAAAARDAGDSAEEARALTTLTRLLHVEGQLNGAREAAAQALEAAVAGRAAAIEAEALGLLGIFELERGGSHDVALEQLERSLAIRRDLRDPIGLLDSHMLLGNAHMGQGRWVAARAAFEENLRLARETGAARDDEATACINVAQVSAEQGELSRAVAAVSDALAIAAESGNRFLEGYALGLKARIEARRGHIRDALAALSLALGIADEIESKYLELAVLAFGAEARLLAGDAPGVLEAALSGRFLAKDRGSSEFDVLLLAALSDAYVALGDHRRARSAAKELADLAARTRNLDATARAGRARVLAGDGDSGTISEARAAAKEAGMAPLLGELGCLSGRLLLAQANEPAAARELQAAYDQAMAMGLPFVAAEAAHTLERIGRGEQVAQSVQTQLQAIAETLDDGDRPAFLARWLSSPVTAASGSAAVLAAPPSDGISEIVAEFAKTINRDLEFDDVLARVVDEVMAISGAERGMILLVDPDGALSGLLARPEDVAGPDGLLAFSKTFVREVLGRRESVWVADAQADARFAAAESILALDLRTVICVPLLDEETVIALLYLDRRSVNQSFTERDLRLVERLSTFAGSAIANATRMREEQARTMLLGAAVDLGQLAARHLEREPLVKAILTHFIQIAGANQASLYQGQPPEPVLVVGRDGATLDTRTDATWAKEVARSGQSTILLGEGYGSSLVVPAKEGDKVVAILQLWSPTGQRQYTPSDLPLIEALAGHAAIALSDLAHREGKDDRIERLDKALRLAADQSEPGNVDNLTGLFRSEYFLTELESEVREARRYPRPLSIVVVDPLKMGELNSRFGAELGDTVLRQLAGELKRMARETDVTARVGGDEFAILLPQTTKSGALDFIERLGKRLSDLAVCDRDGNEVWKIRTAVAAVEWRITEDAATLLDRALRGLASAP
jgi:diguanylate cyclase (GGDEF)-like protein